MTSGSPPALCLERVIQCAQMTGPDMSRQRAEVGQGIRLVQQELRQSLVPLTQIAGGTGGHYVAVGVIAAAHLRLHMVHGQGGCREPRPTVHAAPPVTLKDLIAFHDGPVS